MLNDNSKSSLIIENNQEHINQNTPESLSFSNNKILNSNISIEENENKDENN